MSTENNTSPQVWRVVVACNEVQPHTHTREVNVCRNHLGWFTSETTSLGLATSHAAVMEHVHEKRWPVVEIVAPGQSTRAELEAKIADLEARNADLAKDRDTALASSLALLRARDELRAILDGRETPPTDAEIDAHHAAGGSWLTGDTVTWAPASLRGMRDDGEAEGCTWIALDRDYRPCARPVVEVSE